MSTYLTKRLQQVLESAALEWVGISHGVSCADCLLFTAHYLKTSFLNCSNGVPIAFQKKKTFRKSANSKGVVLDCKNVFMLLKARSCSLVGYGQL